MPGALDPWSSEGALFSPLDVWVVVRALQTKKAVPPSKWADDMYAEFEFTSFAEKFTKTESDFIELAQNLEGGWLKASDLTRKMERNEYLLLSTDLHVKKVLFELGLLSVKQIGAHYNVFLGSPNWTVTENALKLLVKKTGYRQTPADLANSYLSKDQTGFEVLVDSASKAVTNMFRATGQDIIREFPFQDFLFLQLMYRFPIGEDTKDYKLYKEARMTMDHLKG
jgi:hypothetical protein